MKTLFLFLPLFIILSGCNNLNSGAYPNSTLSEGPGSGFDYNGFWLHEGEQVSLDEEGSALQCLSINEEENSGFSVQVMISYASLSVPDELVSLYTISPSNSHRLSIGVDAELILLRVEKSKSGTKAKFKITNKFRL